MDPLVVQRLAYLRHDRYKVALARGEDVHGRDVLGFGELGGARSFRFVEPRYDCVDGRGGLSRDEKGIRKRRKMRL
jgi:hypothetical protein